MSSSIFTKLTRTGSYPPPKDGYGKYADYGKYGKREAEPEANPDTYGKYADYGKYPPKDGYGKYADYGKYGAKDKREAAPTEPSYGKYADYGMSRTSINSQRATYRRRFLPATQERLWKVRKLRQVRGQGQARS